MAEGLTCSGPVGSKPLVVVRVECSAWSSVLGHSWVVIVIQDIGFNYVAWRNYIFVVVIKEMLTLRQNYIFVVTVVMNNS